MSSSASSLRKHPSVLSGKLSAFWKDSHEVLFFLLVPIATSGALVASMFFFARNGQAVGPLRTTLALAGAAILGCFCMIVVGNIQADVEGANAGVVLLLVGLGLPATIPAAVSHPTFVPIACAFLLLVAIFGTHLYKKTYFAVRPEKRELLFFTASFFLPLLTALGTLKWFTKML